MNTKFLLALSLLSLCLSGISQTLIPYYDQGQYGYCDLDGTVKIPPIYDEVAFFSSDAIAIVSKDGRKMIIDKNGSALSSYPGDTEISFAAVTHLIDKDTPGRRPRLGDTIQHLKWVMLNKNEYQLLNLDTKTLSSRYRLKTSATRTYSRRAPQRIEGFSHGYFIGETSNGNYEILNTAGNVVQAIPNKPTIWSSELISFTRGNYSCLLDPVSGRIKEYPYAAIKVVEEQYLITSNRKKDSMPMGLRRHGFKYGLVDLEGRTILDTVYQQILHYNGVYVLEKNGSTFLSDLESNLVDTSAYQSIWPLNDHLFKATRHDSKIQVIEPSGKILFDGQTSLVRKYADSGTVLKIGL